MAFVKIDIKDLKMNPFVAIGKEWMLITAGDENQVNTMTASWGGMGVPVSYTHLHVLLILMQQHDHH